MSVDASDVIAIMNTDLDESEVNPFLSDIQDEYPNLNDRATKWAAAHLVSMMDQRKAKEKGGPVSVTYEGETEMGWQSTRYGQTALRLDSDQILKEKEEAESIFEVY